MPMINCMDEGRTCYQSPALHCDLIFSQNSLSSGGTAESSYSAADSAAAAASASALASMSTSLPVDLSSPQRTASSDAAVAIAAARANGNSTSPLAMDAIRKHMKKLIKFLE